MSRIIGEPVTLLRTWLRRGLLRPIRRSGRALWFDFTELTRARTLQRLVSEGIPPRDLAAALQRAELSDAGIGAIVSSEAGVAIRSRDGTLTDPHGQILLDFEAESKAKESRILEFHIDRDSRFEDAIAAEEEEDYSQAEEIYLDLLTKEGPSAEICYNLGNVLYQLDRKLEAIQRYRQAVEIEFEYLEAWNNLGVTLGEVGRMEESTEVFLIVLKIEPDFADALYNLADTLSQRGRFEEAQGWWKEYLRVDPSSVIAEEVREKITDN